jgi:HAD superfamily hydrolase (TIGR01509 family)
MDGSAVTFDFHNTLATCPDWFDLEVRRLPSSFLRWWADEWRQVIDTALLADADRRYRDLRAEIMDHGNELCAVECLTRVFAGMGLEIAETAIAAGIEHLMRGTLAGASPVPGAVEAVRTLHAAGLPLGIVSSAVYHPFLDWTLAQFGIRDRFQTIVTSASAGFYKSRPEIFWHAADALGTAPERMVHIGDSLRFDVGGAQRAGMGTVWLQRDPVTSDDGTMTPDLTLSTLEAAGPSILSLLRKRRDDRDG